MSVLAQATARGDLQLRRGVSNRFGVRWQHSADAGESFAPVDLAGWDLTCRFSSLQGAPLLAVPVVGDADGYAIAELAPNALDDLDVAQGVWKLDGHEYDPDITNHFQGIRGADDWAEVRRNLAQSPVETATRNAWRSSSSSTAIVETSTEHVLPGRTHSAKCTLREGWTSTPGVYQSTPGNGGPVTSGKTAPGERVGCWVWLEIGRTIRFQIAEVNPTGSIVGSRMVARTYPGTGDWQWIEGITTVAKTNAANALCAWPYALAADNGGNAVFSWWVSSPLNQADTLPGPQFDGSSSARSIDPDMRQRWLGAENGSSSVMEIERVSGFAAQRCIAGVSSRSGKPAIRLIATVAGSGGTNSYIQISIPAAARGGGTLMGTRHQQEQIGSPRANDYMGVRVQHPTQQQVANSVGETPLRLHYEPVTSQFIAILGHGGALGAPDVWYTDVALVAGVYLGEAFTGEDPPTDTHAFRWAGVPYQSASIRYRTAPHVVERLGDGYFYLEG